MALVSIVRGGIQYLLTVACSLGGFCHDTVSVVLDRDTRSRLTGEETFAIIIIANC